MIRQRPQRSIPTTVLLPPELRRAVEHRRDQLRTEHPEASFGDAVRDLVKAGVEARDDQRSAG